ncbi:hypothetical protein GJAV_G00052660 [Gymnothorax javanicus]|nr:hypothetical protein GJAV_G00052660 [Gymnothorax javanicus]
MYVWSLLALMAPSLVISDSDPWQCRHGDKPLTTEELYNLTNGQVKEGQSRGHGDTRRAQFQRERAPLAPVWGWDTVMPAGEVGALCQEEAPLHHSLCLEQVWSRSLLAGGLWLSLGLCVLLLKRVLRRSPSQQGAPFLHSEEIVREEAASQQTSLPSGSSANGPIPLAKALMDSLLLCLLSESVDDPCPTSIQALTRRLEMLNQTLMRADILGENQKPGGVQGLGGCEENQQLTNSLQGVCTFLQQRVQRLRSLSQAQEDYGSSVQRVEEVLTQSWDRLVQLHVQVTLTRERSAAEEQVLAAVKREREGEEEDVETTLRSVEHFSIDLAERKDKLHESRAHLRDTKHLLQELEGSLQALGETAGAEAESVWTKQLQQSNTLQFEEVVEDFLSLQWLTCCFRSHLEGLRADKLGSGEPPPHPNPSASARTPDPPPRPSFPPPAPPKLPRGAKALHLYQRSAQRLSASLKGLPSPLRRRV